MTKDTGVEKLAIKKTRDIYIYNHNLITTYFYLTNVSQCSLVSQSINVAWTLRKIIVLKSRDIKRYI